MDRRLLDAAQAGNVEDLHQLLRENPLILHTTALASAENPLHISSISGHVDFVKELIRLKPDFIKELNQDGFSPIHMAAANGHQEGRSMLFGVILSACKECIEDVTVQKEIALHLAVKNSQYEAVRVLVEKVREMRREDVLNMKDEHGNTILHLATWRKQRQASSSIQCRNMLYILHQIAFFIHSH
ncbi:Ankyrin repeat-containing protein BDA1 [Vitis vinifera]|uniref:Ankyrin repeat-containing protein BDA1 n=1 Tax=Vitis vinifera TaxID=29760 RepID=A0A438IYM7_VITVI|nr:Ankyrin repeat-containing protein BDA1 [Vitis vinifera]